MTVKKATSIDKETREWVAIRDAGLCIFCGRQAVDIMHYISRGRLGMGIEQNLACGCRECHMKYDHSSEKKEYEKRFKVYLDRCYPNFKDEDRIYKKGSK